jgi:hypothetical protein
MIRNKKRIFKWLLFITAVIFLWGVRGGRENMYYIPSRNISISVCSSMISNNYYVFFSKDGDSDMGLSSNWIKCDSYGRNQFLIFQFDSSAPDSVYNNLYKTTPPYGFSRKAEGTDIVYIQGSVESIINVHSETLRFMLFNHVENWSGPQEFPEYKIGGYPVYDNPYFELLMYNDNESDGLTSIVKMIPVWSKHQTKFGWMCKALRRGLSEF